MTEVQDGNTRLTRPLQITFGIFAVGSTFSIALAQMALGVSLVLFLVALLTRCIAFPWRQHRPVWIAIGLYLFWLLVSAVLGPSPGKSLIMSREEWLFLAIPIGAVLLRDEWYRRRLFVWFAVAVAVWSLYGMIEYATWTHWLHRDGVWFSPQRPLLVVSGNFSHYLTFANYYATAAFLLLGWSLEEQYSRGRSRMFYLLVAVMGIVAVVLTLRRGPIAFLLIGLVLLALLKGARVRRYVLGFGAIIVLLCVSLPLLRDRLVTDTLSEWRHPGTNSRQFIWSTSVRMMAARPLFGAGQGNYVHRFAELVPPGTPEEHIQVHAHNDILNIAAIGGIPLLAAWLGIWWTVFRNLVKSWRKGFTPAVRQAAFAALCGGGMFFLTGLTEATFADEEVRQMLMFVWGLGLAACAGRADAPAQT